MAKDDISKIKSLVERMDNPTNQTDADENLQDKKDDDKQNPRTSMTYFTILSERSTGVKPQMLFDCDGVYEACGESPFLYVCNGYLDVKHYVETMDFIKISVNSNPQVLSFHPPFNIFKRDIFAIYDLIKKNLDLILKLSSGEIGTITFIRSLKKPTYSNQIQEDRITPDISGVMCDIWIDNTLSFEKSQHNEPRIKFQPDQGIHKTKEFATLILNGLKLDTKQETSNFVNPKYLKEAKKFATANMEYIIELYNGKKTIEQFMDDIVVVGKEKKDRRWSLIDNEPSFGCRRVMFDDGKFNYINDNNDIVYQKDNFEYAEPFQKNEDGVILAYVRYKNDGFVITQPDFELSYFTSVQK